jgi:hypothetical protein
VKVEHHLLPSGTCKTRAGRNESCTSEPKLEKVTKKTLVERIFEIPFTFRFVAGNPKMRVILQIE